METTRQRYQKIRSAMRAKSFWEIYLILCEWPENESEKQVLVSKINRTLGQSDDFLLGLDVRLHIWKSSHRLVTRCLRL